MSQRKAIIEHVPVVRHHEDQPATERAIVIFDLETGRRIGHSPHCKIEQVDYKKHRGTITTTLKIRTIKDN